MKFQPGDYEAVHLQPAWGELVDFVFVAYLGFNEGRNEWEQFWGRRTAEYRFMVCCIPFFANDIDLGDEVETDADWVVQRVVRKSGHVTFRVWFGEQNAATREAVLGETRPRNV